MKELMWLYFVVYEQHYCNKINKCKKPFLKRLISASKLKNRFKAKNRDWYLYALEIHKKQKYELKEM